MNIQELEKTVHFLVVDDDAESRSTIVEYLRSMGFNKLTLAHDGTEAIRLLDHDPTINFIISDWDMPMMNGLSLLQRIKFNSERAHIPFLVVTSPVSEEAEKVVLAAENLVDGYLIKPFRSHILEEKIRKILTVKSLGTRQQLVIVDDDPDARDMLTEYVRQMGFKEVIPFPEGRSALEYIRKNVDRVGMIISDWDMPSMNGIELLKACKSESVINSIPFLMVTSQTSIEKMKVLQAARSNVDQYMLKPFNLEEFQKRIETTISKSKTQAEVKKLTTEGMDLLSNGRDKLAFNKFEEALKVQPDYEMALRGMAEVTIKVKGLQSCVAYYKKAIDVNPTNARSYLDLAGVYEKLGWPDRAITLLQSGNQQVGFNAELHFLLGKIYVKKNMKDQAKVEFERTLEIQLDHQEARLMLEMLSLEKEDESK